MTKESDLIKRVSKLFKEKCPEIDFNIESENEMKISSTSDDGFDILIQQSEREITLYFSTWHWHFENTEDSKNELLDLLFYGMTKLGRLKVFSKNKKEHKWEFEIINEKDGKWHSQGVTGLINLKFWQESEIKYYQNDFVNLEVSEE